MYKDQDKQREANRQAQARFKAKAKGITSQGITDEVLPDGTMSIETLVMMDVGCGNKLDHGLKRGLAIKCFEDLPPDVQQTIIRLSRNNDDVGALTQEHNRRTAIAIHYQHLFPNRYYSTGVA